MAGVTRKVIALVLATGLIRDLRLLPGSHGAGRPGLEAP
jgi:hypothetical protein